MEMVMTALTSPMSMQPGLAVASLLAIGSLAFGLGRRSAFKVAKKDRSMMDRELLRLRRGAMRLTDERDRARAEAARRRRQPGRVGAAGTEVDA